MIIRWFGECSFLFQDSLGRRIITDPFNVPTNKNLLNYNPKIITLSHEHIPIISSFIKDNDTIIINDTTIHKFDYATIIGYSSFHDKFLGIKRGYNIIYKLLFDNLSICHLGHLGHLISDDFIKSLGEIDILLIPIGGHFTLNGEEAAILAKKFNPTIVIPMYYKIGNSLNYLDNPQNFLTSMDNVIVYNDSLLNTHLLEASSTCKTIFLKENSILL